MGNFLSGAIVAAKSGAKAQLPNEFWLWSPSEMVEAEGWLDRCFGGR